MISVPAGRNVVALGLMLVMIWLPLETVPVMLMVIVAPVCVDEALFDT